MDQDGGGEAQHLIQYALICILYLHVMVEIMTHTYWKYTEIGVTV